MKFLEMHFGEANLDGLKQSYEFVVKSHTCDENQPLQDDYND